MMTTASTLEQRGPLRPARAFAAWEWLLGLPFFAFVEWQSRQYFLISGCTWPA